MAVQLDLSSVQLTVTPSRGNATFVHTGTARALFFCKAGGINLKAADADAPAGMKKILSHAISWKGRVSLSGDPKSGPDLAELRTKWKFGFLQVSNTMVEQSIYAGRIDTEGSMIADKKPAYAPNPCIDSGDVFPFTGDPADAVVVPGGTGKASFIVTAEDGDHPNYMLPYERENRASSARNFLFSGRRDEGFTTVFTAIDPAGKKTFLAHFNWHVVWDSRFRWKSGTAVPTKAPITLRMDVGPSTLGPPTDAAILAVCTNPALPSANDMDRDGEIAIWDQRKIPLLTQNKSRPADLPPDFFT